MLNEQPAPIDEATTLIGPGGTPRSPEHLRAYVETQRKRTLEFIIWMVLLAALVLGTFDIQFRTWDSVLTLYALVGLCVPALILNERGRYRAAASIVSLAALLVITVNLIDGDGVRDPGILAYPVFIMFGALFFGRRAAPYFALAASLSIGAVVALEVLGRLQPTLGPIRFSILIPLVTLLAAGAGIVWATVRNLEKHLERAAESEAELNKNYDLTLQAWSNVLEYRDRETEGHSRRLLVLGARLARALGLQETDIQQLQRGALLHDIGKLAIPDEILLKPSTLTPDEIKLMQRHPVYAKQMLSGIPFLQPSLAVAYSHHERWDGQGYPEGLKGEEIPLLARLFAVIDTWDALNSDRVYRPAWPPEQIKEYLAENAGVRFDPHIVDTFLGMMQ